MTAAQVAHVRALEHTDVELDVELVDEAPARSVSGLGAVEMELELQLESASIEPESALPADAAHICDT